MLMRTSDQHNRWFITCVLTWGATFFLLAALSPPASCALAQVAAVTPVSTPSSAKMPVSRTLAKNSSTAPISSKPVWQDLTPLQQLSLKPLAANWNTMGESQKRKWIALALNYPNLAPAEQTKLHSRMTEWVSLSRQQRDQARLNFARSKQLTPSQKAATWKAYQALSPEEKQKLAISAVPKPAGAAAAAKPVPAQKLAVVPMTRQTPKPAPRMAITNHTLNHNTLLPQSQPSLETAPTQKN